MKPSERIIQIQKSLSGDGAWTKQETINAAFLQYLDEAFEAKDENAFTRGTDLVELLKQIEIQKFTAQNQAVRFERDRIKKIFNSEVDEHGQYLPKATVEFWREKLFGKEGAI